MADPCEAIYSIWKFANRIKMPTGTHLRLACFIQALDTAGELAAVAVSLYIALYLSGGDILNVLLNVLVLEFVASLDDAILAELVKHRYGGLVSIAILECPHANPSDGLEIEENVYWKTHDAELDSVRSKLRSDDVPNDDKWGLIVEGHGNGIGINDRPFGFPYKPASRRRDEVDMLKKDIHIDLATLRNNRLGLVGLPMSKSSHPSELSRIRTLLEGSDKPLEIWHKYLHPQQKRNLIKAFPSYVFTFVRRVKLQRASIDDLLATKIGRAIENSEVVLDIDLRNNNVMDEGMVAIAKGRHHPF